MTSDDLNAYVREAMGDEFTAKDFRTWHGTVLCAVELSAAPGAESPAERRSVLSGAIKAVAVRLRNTAAVCRSSYVHPGVIERFLASGHLDLPPLKRRIPKKMRELAENEARVLRFLERAAKRPQARLLRGAQAPQGG